MGRFYSFCIIIFNFETIFHFFFKKKLNYCVSKFMENLIDIALKFFLVLIYFSG